MKTIDLVQGTPEWHAFRAAHHGSSEAPAMMGASTKVQRNELLRVKATGSDREFSQFIAEVLFARGHAVEALARPFAEKIIGQELFPAIGESDEHPKLSSSFDGITMAEDICWECKQWNEAKATDVRAGRVPEEDIWQCVHQLTVSGAERLLYMVSDGTEEGTVHCWLARDAAASKRLLAGWTQFDEDVAAYTPEAPRQEFLGRAPEHLPALLIEVAGAVRQSNLPEFKAQAIAVFRNIKTDLATDQDFADADKTVKWCKDIEDRLDAAKQHALSQTASIDELFRTIDEISEEARQTRLALDKKVKGRKEQIRAEIIEGANRAFREHCAQINKRLARVSLPLIPPNFALAIRGLKTVDSLNNAVATELARAKIEANATAERIEQNLRALKEHADGYDTLFPDLSALALKEPDDFVARVKSRVSDHLDQTERRRIAAEADRQRTPTFVSAKPGEKPRYRAPLPPSRPTDTEIVQALVDHFHQPRATVIEWLRGIQLQEAA